MMQNRILCFIVILSLLLTILVSCQRKQDNNGPFPDTSGSPPITSTPFLEETTAPNRDETATNHKPTEKGTPVIPTGEIGTGGNQVTATPDASRTPGQTPTKTPIKTPANTTTNTPNKTSAPTKVTFPSTLSADTLFPIRNDGHVVNVNSTAGGMQGETAEKLFDSDFSTKLCTENTGYTIVWKLDGTYPVGGYSVTTANDSAQYGRLPQGWTLEASKDGNSWTTVSVVKNSGIQNSNYTEYFYAFSKPDFYRYFRFILTKPTSDMTQMSEITLYQAARPESANVNLSGNTYGKAGITLLKQIINDYYDRSTHILRGEPNSSEPCAVWAAASFAEALAEGYRLCPNDDLIYRTYVDVLDHCLTAYKVNGSITTPTGNWNVSYYNATRGNGGDYYYDDDAWICLQYLNAYTLLGEKTYLKRAEEMLDFFWTGWDSKLGGGIYWDKSFQGKHTCANAPIAIAFLSAYEMTGKESYLTKGKQIYDWCRSKLLEDHLYSDSVALDGSINHWKAAYNQGTMLCVGSLLYRITGESRYLSATKSTYYATVNHMFRVSGNKVSMHGNPIYKSWCIGWLQRGLILFEKTNGKKVTKGTDYMNRVLDQTLQTKNKAGYYDPYFCTGDWTNESTTDVLQPCGVASVLLLAGLYQ